MLYIFLFGILLSIIIGLAVWAIIEAVQHKTKKNKIVVGDCKNTRWGCCPDGIVPKYEPMGSNCITKKKPKNPFNPSNLLASPT
jgi:hypothetical protein